jgi:hypothetical protein
MDLVAATTSSTTAPDCHSNLIFPKSPANPASGTKALLCYDPSKTMLNKYAKLSPLSQPRVFLVRL